MKRKGKVTKIGKSQYSYYILLDGDQFYFNTKFNPDKIGVGDVVGIVYDKKGDKRGQVTNVKLLEDNGGPKGFQDNGGGGGGGRKYSGGGNDDRQESIIYQSSRKDALVLVGLILSNDGITLPKDADARRTVIEELVDETTVRFVKDASDPSKACKNSKEAESDESGDDWDDDSSKDEGGDWDDDWS